MRRVGVVVLGIVALLVPSVAQAWTSVSNDGITVSPAGGAPFRGSLVASIDSSGKLSYALSGWGVGYPAPGRYAIRVTDRSTRTGLVLEQRGKAPIALTAPGFVGTRSKTLFLTPGSYQVVLSFKST